MIQVREPAAWLLDLGPRRGLHALRPTFARAAAGVACESWEPPPWLYPHQVPAARRMAGALDAFGCALLADAVGLGKTYVALALAHRAGGAVAVVPAALRAQWARAAARTNVSLDLVTHEALSRRGRVPAAPLVIVDEAHRFRNPATRRHDRLARDLHAAPVLFVTATPVVNRPADLHHLLRLALPDHALAALGVPSLEEALAAGRFAEVLHAALPLMVARTEETAGHLPARLPEARDAPLVREPPVSTARLRRILTHLDGLRFPGFGDTAPALLHRHLLYRLTSSVEALAESVRRHVRYCHRARDAALRGEPLPRGLARALFGAEDDGQLELLLADAATAPLELTALDAEGARLEALAACLGSAGARPKEQALHHWLATRRGHRTLLFTTAQATAHRLARTLGWEQVAVVTGGGARIASGRVSVEEAFGLFAPAARGRAPPARRLAVHILIATDLASEGLDLQDADAVVHYDLPWNPVRLAQRTGRIARLGSRHRTVAVRWFAPPPCVEERLGLLRRIDRKLRVQLQLAVPASSRVGAARITSRALDARERLIAGGADRRPVAGHAVVAGPCHIVALAWRRRGSMVRELVGLAPTGEVLDPDRFVRILEQPESPAGEVAHPAVALGGLIRRRLMMAGAGPLDPVSRRLARRVLARARTAARHRRLEQLALLDEVLSRIHAGLRIGETRALADLLCGRLPLAAVREWLARVPLRDDSWEEPTLDATVVGVAD